MPVVRMPPRQSVPSVAQRTVGVGGVSLSGIRVLVAEDEMLVSLVIEDILTDSECVVVGPFHRVQTALEAARAETLDAAVLDVNLSGIMIYPVAEILAARGIPFVLVSGYGRGALPAAHQDWH